MGTVGSMLRLFVFRPPDAETTLDVALRDRIVPELLGLAGIRAAFAGRRGSGEDSRRVMASVWEPDAPASGIEASLMERSSGYAGRLPDARVDVLPLAVTISTARTEEPRILRVFRGEVRAGELDAYVEEARTGTLSDLATKEGPIALYLGTQPPARFVTVSAWTGWEPIELATGGNIRQPMATRNAARIVAGQAAHYEIITSGTREA